MTSTGDMTAARILESARQLIMRRGYSGFSYADIAEAIDIRKASIHHHFPAKSDLVAAVVRQSTELFDADMASLEEQGADALELIRAYVGYWESCIADDSAPFCVGGMLGAELPSLPDDVAQAVREHFDGLTAWIERTLESGVASGALKLGKPAPAEAVALVSSVYGAMLAARAFGDPGVFSEVAGAAVERLVKPRRASRRA